MKKELDKKEMVWYYTRALPAGGAKVCQKGTRKMLRKRKKVLDKELVLW